MTASRLRLTIFIAVTIFFTGCSLNSTLPSEPDIFESNTSLTGTLQDNRVSETVESNHTLWGIFQISIDPETLQPSVSPNRELMTHYDVKNLLLPPACNDCMAIQINSYDPLKKIIDADITLRNPSLLNGYDVRGILFTDDSGRTLLNADDWTNLFDIPGGEDINPFRTYAKSEQSRIFAPDAEHTENFLIDMAQITPVQFAVDASWPGNCKEPYEIDQFTQSPIYQDPGSSGQVSVYVYDWMFDVDEVTLSVPDISGTEFVNLDYFSDSVWSTELVNVTGAPPGKYEALITAGSEDDENIELFDKVDVTISGPHPALNITDITPLWLNFTPGKLCVDGNYLYTTSSRDGVHIWDITIQDEPVWVTKIDLPQLIDIHVENGLAYINNGHTHIYDVDPPEDATLLKTLSIGSASDYENGYVYSTAGGCTIWDVDPWETAHIVNTVNLEFDQFHVSYGLSVGDGYVCVLDYDSYIGDNVVHVVDVDPPELAHEVFIQDFYSTSFNHFARVCNGLAYMCSIYGLKIYEASTGNLLSTVEEITGGGEIKSIDGYVYVAGYSDVSVLDVTDPEEPLIIGEMQSGKHTLVARSENYLYVSGQQEGLRIYDYEPPGEPNLVNFIYSTYQISDLAAANGKVFTITGDFVTVADVDPLEGIEYVSNFPALYHLTLKTLCATDSYLYVVSALSDNDKLRIYDTTSSDLPEEIIAVDTHGDHNAITVDDGYAYIIGKEDGLEIFDIDPPETAHYITSLELENGGYDVDAMNGYIYVADYGNDEIIGGLQIIDATNPSSPFIVKTIANEDDPSDELNWRTEGVEVDESYAYVGCSLYQDGRIRIIDISSPEDAYIVNSVLTEGEITEMCLSNDYLFVPHNSIFNDDGIAIFDVSDPLNVFYTQNIEFYGCTSCKMAVDAPYAYVNSGRGMEVFRLW